MGPGMFDGLAKFFAIAMAVVLVLGVAIGVIVVKVIQ